MTTALDLSAGSSLNNDPVNAGTGFGGPIRLGRLFKTHPRLSVKRVRTLHAWYRGGQSLLGNQEIMSTVFPRYTYEGDGVYAERCQRAFYENMFGLVINQISAGLAQDPLHFMSMIGEDNAVKPDEYWEELMENATPLSDDGSTQRSLDQIMRDSCVEAMVSGWSWLQAELPAADPDSPPPQSLKEQEDAGLLRAYVVSWATDQVTDWSEKRGKLTWLRTYQQIQDDSDPSRDRQDVLHVWTIWTDTEWLRYEFLQEKNKSFPNDDTPIPLKSRGDHTFGRVPWIRLDFSGHDGPYLHVGDVIESPCRNYFNRQNGESYQWVQFYFQQLYEFLGPEISGIDTPISEAQTDTSRARRRRAPGIVHVRGNEDRAEFVGPNMAGAEAGRSALQDLRDAVFRTTSQMALSQDTSGAMLRRSGESKAQDSLAAEILLGAIGKRVVIAANHLLTLLQQGAQVAEPPKLAGYEHFSVQDTDAMLQQSMLIEQINIPSATFQREEKFQAAIAKLGDGCSEEMKQAIREELAQVITQDQLMLQNMYVPPDPGADPNADPNQPPTE